MNYSKIGIRYAKALLLNAIEENILENIKDDMTLIQNVITTVPEFNFFFNSPVTRPSEKIKVFNTALSSKLNKLTVTFIEMVITNRRENHLTDIVRNFFDLYKKQKGILSATLTTSVAVDENIKKKISELLKSKYQKTIDLQTNTNDKIIGGFVLQIEDKQLDASVHSQLKNIRKNLEEIQL